MHVPLVISYPENGLLTSAGAHLPDIASEYYGIVDVRTIPAQHSTLGGSKGSQRKAAFEQLLVLSD